MSELKIYHGGRYWTAAEVEAENDRLMKWLDERAAAREAKRMHQATVPTFTVKDNGTGPLVVTGVASTNNVDRMADVVLPEGMEASFPLPFLLSHDASNPIGQVTSARHVGNGINMTATIFRGISTRIDESAALIKAGLYRGLSIGFQSLEHEKMPGGGLRFKRWELLEISAVSIPANRDGRITNVAAKHWHGEELKGARKLRKVFI